MHSSRNLSTVFLLSQIYRAKNAQVEIAKVLDIGGFNVRRVSLLLSHTLLSLCF